MSHSTSGGERPITLDELIALNDEIAALIRAGVPLEHGLLRFGGDVRGRLGRLAASLGQHLSAGMSLPQALEADASHLPPLYVAMVRAGLAAGRLPAALERLAETARALAELRRVVAGALLYPLGVMLLAYYLLIWLMQEVLPAMVVVLEDFNSPAAGFLRWAEGLSAGLLYWWWVPPLAICLAPALWWRRSRRGALVEPAVAGRLMGWLPWFRRMLEDSQAATFAETLALFVEHRLPLGESVRLAAEATGSRRLRQFGLQFSQALERGQSFEPSTAASGLPPLLCWLLGANQVQRNLAAALRSVAEDYRERALVRAETMRVVLPLIFTLGIGGTAVLAYTVVLMMPWTVTLQELAAPL